MTEILKKVIINIVSTNLAINGVSLVMKVMNEVNPQKFDHRLYAQVLDDLVNGGEIVELEYISPGADYRIKSLYFKKGTKFGRPTVDSTSDSNIHIPHIETENQS